MEITIGVALLAGLVSFASPCFLPIVPAFVGQLVGTRDDVSRVVALRNSVAFVVGFSVVFIGMWASIGLIGRSLGPALPVLRIIGGAILILMGLNLAGFIDVAVFQRVLRMPVKPSATPGLGRAAVMGLIFGAGWTPCIGPILGGILALATVSSTVGQGAALMVAYCLGLGIPLILVAVGLTGLMDRLDWFRRHQRAVSIISGVLLVLIGFLLITNLFEKLANLIPGFGI